MFTKEKIRCELIKQLSVDFNCNEEDFYSERNVLTIPALNEGRRMYSEKVNFFSMVTLGQNAIISADAKMHPFLKEYISDKQGIWLFEQDNIASVEKELSKYGEELWHSHHLFLPDTKPLKIKPGFQVKWFEENEIGQFYGDSRFPNAFCEKYEPGRPDVLGVCALIDGKMAGMAGCSADSRIMWQIGIDVMPSYRGNGIGTALVGLLKNEIFNRGAIPFYGTSLSNIYSQNIAINCGFYPVWTEISTK